jgi:hypothetical protein
MVGINPAKVSDDLITRASIGYGERLGLKFTQARSEDVIKLTRKYTTISVREHAMHPFCAEATWCVVDVPPLRDAPAFPDFIVVFRYALMSPEETEDHVMSQMPPPA